MQFAQICKALRFITLPFVILLILLTAFSVAQLTIPELAAISPPKDAVVTTLITTAIFTVVFTAADIAFFVIYALYKKKEQNK